MWRTRALSVEQSTRFARKLGAHTHSLHCGLDPMNYSWCKAGAKLIPPSLGRIRTVKTRSQQRQEAKTVGKARKGRIDRQELHKLHRQLEEGLQDMAKLNDHFDIHSDGEEFTIGTEVGIIRLFVSQIQEEEVLALTIPKGDNPTGMFTYRFDHSTGEWIGKDDGHFLRELLARELVFYCKGFPKF